MNTDQSMINPDWLDLECWPCEGGGLAFSRDCQHQIGHCDCFQDSCEDCQGTKLTAIPHTEFK